MNRDLERYIAENYQTAIDKGYIRPYYQPVIRTISRQLCSFEALARWEDPVHGMIAPDQFIPVLEKCRAIHRLDACIIRQVCARLRRSMEMEDVPIPVSVNLSRRDFELCDIFKTVDGIVAQYQIPHDFLYIEVTESVMAEQEGRMHEIVDRFRAAGYQVWMDDFGSAYSSLNVLKDFDFNEIKLDMRFLSSFNLRSQRILTAVIQMAKEINIHTLAEGVETQEQVRYLRNIGCEKVQGFFFGRPMPYDEALEHLRRQDIAIERPQDRQYYDDIGLVNFLSAVPFMSRAERDALKTARQLNSIPLALAEGRRDSFSILFYNTAFEQTAAGTGMITNPFSQETLRAPQPYSVLPVRVVDLMDSTRINGEGRMFFISNDEYYELKAKCVARTRDAYSVLMRLSNLSKASQSEKTDHLDDSLRQLITLFERITLIDTDADTIAPLYVGTLEDLLSGRSGIVRLAQEFADTLIFPEDRENYLRLVDFSNIEERLHLAGRTYLSGYFRTSVRHGQYAWKKYIVLRLHSGLYAELIRDVHADLVSLIHEKRLPQSSAETGDGLTDEQLWRNLIRSDIARLFWKDADRRFLGASRGFLDYYGFDSVEDIIGKTDEDLGWHVHPDKYMNDEYRVIQEGVSTHNVPGRCINFGENREILASKAPLYDNNGKLSGLIGIFMDRDLLNINDKRGKETKRRDFLTGLLNSRGITEEAHTFEDEYNLRNIDFVRMHVAIDDFASLNRQYGFDFGDKAISALGRALKKTFGLTCAVGRYTGHQFVILHQVHDSEEVLALSVRVKETAIGLQQIDGVPVTLYLSVGYSVYSESENLEEQKRKAELRLLADHNEHTSMERRIARASEIFHLYDDLPISYSVYRVILDEEGQATDAVLFYANRIFEARSGMKASQMVGRKTSALFPTVGADWYEKAKRAAYGQETMIDKLRYAPTGKWYYMTVSPILHTGYCCFTYQEMDVLDDLNPKDGN